MLTDRAEATFEFWQGNPRLAPFVAAGRLDFAHFDPTADRTVVLQRAGTELAPGEVANPMVVVTNYLFDAAGRIFFAVVDVELHEELVEVYLDDAAVTERVPDFFDHVRLALHRRPFSGPDGAGRTDALARRCSGPATASVSSFRSEAWPRSTTCSTWRPGGCCGWSASGRCGGRNRSARSPPRPSSRDR